MRSFGNGGLDLGELRASAEHDQGLLPHCAFVLLSMPHGHNWQSGHCRNHVTERSGMSSCPVPSLAIALPCPRGDELELQGRW